MIGGIEIELLAPATDSISDLIVRQVAEFWPEARVQDANSAKVCMIGDPDDAISETKNLELFIFRDAAAAESWQNTGAFAGNSNTMLHFIVEDAAEAKLSMQRITVVYDEETAQISRLVEGLRTAFGTLAPNP